MIDEEFRRLWGNEFPAAVTVGSIRMLLQRETRFCRYYYNEKERHGAQISKFKDGSASITFDELTREWPKWDESDRLDFAWNCSYIEQSDFPDILRFILSSDAPSYWNAVATIAGCRLPKDEGFKLLSAALEKAPLGETANLVQGIALTKHAKARTVLRAHLEVLWSNPELWKPDSFSNRFAFDATCCIQHLLELGEAPSKLESKARALVNHACAGNRRTARQYLQKYYGWSATERSDGEA